MSWVFVSALFVQCRDYQVFLVWQVPHILSPLPKYGTQLGDEVFYKGESLSIHASSTRSLLAASSQSDAMQFTASTWS